MTVTITHTSSSIALPSVGSRSVFSLCVCNNISINPRFRIMRIIQALVATTTLLNCCNGYYDPSADQQQKNGFILGHRQPGDEMIEQRKELAHGSPDYVLTYARTYVASNEHLVTQIDVDDLGHHGAMVALVAGGPGHTFASLFFTILRHGEMHFNVTLYGKLPPYRKILD